MDGNNTFIDHFSTIPDPRIDRTKRHNLIDILVIAVVGTLCGSERWEDFETIAEEKFDWLKKFLELPNGIPSHDTISRVITRIDAEIFEKCFINWMKDVAQLTDGEIVAIDGKRVRGSYDTQSSKAAIHMVSAWAQGNGLVLGQIKVADKSNEITAIPKLLETLDLKGCIVTIDAMGCQTEIAKKILEEEADYVLSLKGNQGKTHDSVREYFDTNLIAKEKSYTTVDNDHGRLETREYYVADVVSIVGLEKWFGIKSIAMVNSIVEKNEKTTSEKRYFISSLEPDAKNLARAIRGHWAVENSLHWVLDVTFNEDHKRIRKGDAPENNSVLRRIALNLLKQEKTLKTSIRSKKLKCCLSNKYLENVVFSAK